MLNSCINGYDGSLMGSINSYEQYRSYFGFDPDEGTPSTGIVYAIYTIGNIVGSFTAGPFTDFKGDDELADSDLAADDLFGTGTFVLLYRARGRSSLQSEIQTSETNRIQSPRWLISQDKHEAALKVLAEYHGEGDRNAPIVQLEYREMVEDISMTGSDKRWWDYRELFNSRETRYRSMLMLRGAGIENNNTRLLLQGLQNVVQFIGAVFGALITDRVGRRPQLLLSTGIIVILFAIVLALNATNVVDGPDGEPIAKSGITARAQIAMIFIFGFVYSAGWTPNQAMYPVECLRYESRAKGMGMNNFFVNIASFYNTFVTGIAFSGAGWKYYFLFIFWDAFEFIIIYFLFVETSKRTLEELTAIFQAKSPVKASLKKDEVFVASDGAAALQKEV
ncbi:unnamed protein product [Aspergillus oryzae]|uniref:Unnamed protein product n=2 Tax=Aspergillus oryzae TaxID=5062 RepID=A0AAN4YJ78_ASPOZ|nr:unnamed protein product [Aspergillus oryzae]GMF91386.1 unnamed protein product [Aspergillus oryzae]GMG03079.1 unnamed protein product [Aspergillus oryzae]GMG29932.1 unnamed protein product [Aspergillus oryzae]GMG46381.1 unnamed protein product [Aspergillus oryzae var. brunneus]